MQPQNSAPSCSCQQGAQYPCTCSSNEVLLGTRSTWPPIPLPPSPPPHTHTECADVLVTSVLCVLSAATPTRLSTHLILCQQVDGWLWQGGVVEGVPDRGHQHHLARARQRRLPRLYTLKHLRVWMCVLTDSVRQWKQLAWQGTSGSRIAVCVGKGRGRDTLCEALRHVRAAAASRAAPLRMQLRAV